MALPGGVGKHPDIGKMVFHLPQMSLFFWFFVKICTKCVLKAQEIDWGSDFPDATWG